jgi:hypothetical protein
LGQKAEESCHPKMGSYMVAVRVSDLQTTHDREGAGSKRGGIGQAIDDLRAIGVTIERYGQMVLEPHALYRTDVDNREVAQT